jgi:tungstate transport system substrate-binding protein
MCVAIACSSNEPELDLATTTSVQNSGLLDALTASYSERQIRAHAAGSGRALEMLADGIVNVVISHAPDAEARYLAEHPEWSYQKIAYNQFVIVGPASDPAKINSAQDSVEALRRIAASGSTFVSRGDASGTHEREESLWAAAGTKPPPAQLLVSGRGMATALRHAEERSAYTLSDEATFWQFQDQLALVILVSGDPRLLNTYAVIHPTQDVEARAFSAWVASGEGRTVIERFTIAGKLAFPVWPAGCPGDDPHARPCSS